MEMEMTLAREESLDVSALALEAEPFSVSIIEDESRFLDLRDEWNELADQSEDASVFQRHEFAAAWWQAERDGSALFIVAVWQGQKLCALAPLCISPTPGTPLVRMLQFLGGSAGDYLNFLLSRTEMLKPLVDAILAARDRWDVWSIKHLPNWSSVEPLIAQELRRANLVVQEQGVQVAPWLALPEDPKNIFESLAKGVRYDLRKGLERLNEIGPVRYEVIRDQQAALELLPEFMDTLWQREASAQRAAAMSAHEWRKRFFSALIGGAAFELVHFSILFAEAVPVAWHIGFKHRGKLYWYKPTFALEFSKAQPGKLLIRAIIESAAAERISEFDFLLGEEPYKFQWTNATRTVSDRLVFSDTVRSRVARLWLAKLRPWLQQSRQLRTWIRWLRARGGN